MNFAAQFIIFSIIIHHTMDYLAEFFVHSGFSLISLNITLIFTKSQKFGWNMDAGKFCAVVWLWPKPRLTNVNSQTLLNTHCMSVCLSHLNYDQRHT